MPLIALGRRVAQVGPEGHVIGAVSGGVDSSVAAVLLHRAIGARFHAIMVDNGCLRKVNDDLAPLPARSLTHHGGQRLPVEGNKRTRMARCRLQTADC